MERKLFEKRDVPLLGQEEIKNLSYDFEKKKRKRLSRFGKLYALTVFVTIAVLISLLLIGLRVDAKLFSQDYFDALSDLILGNGYLNSWGSNDDDGFDEHTGTTGTTDIQAGITKPDNTTAGTTTATPSIDINNLYSYDYSKVPEGHTPIIPMDLSLYKNGDNYINNATGYKPDIEALLNQKFGSSSLEYLASTKAPTVLIIHTHGTEAYSDEGAISYLDDGGDIARSTDNEENVVAVGSVIAKIFNEKGIETLHCTILHDSVQYKDSYLRAEQTIKQYREKYPTIKLVIDLHRDSIIKSSGELVRPVTVANGKRAAQIMCVVGSDWGGGYCPNWQNNLSLALKLRRSLNTKYTNICRPTNLRTASFNQELAPYSLLLEIGSSGNSLDEAKYSAALVAEELIKLIPEL